MGILLAMMAILIGLQGVRRREDFTVWGSSKHYVFSRRSPPKSLPSGVEFLDDDINVFVSQLRAPKGKNIWLMGGGTLIASFLDASAIDHVHWRRGSADCTEAPRHLVGSKVSQTIP